MIISGKNSCGLSEILQPVIDLNRTCCTHKISILETNKSLCCLRLCVIMFSKARCAFENIETLLASLCKWFVL